MLSTEAADVIPFLLETWLIVDVEPVLPPNQRILLTQRRSTSDSGLARRLVAGLLSFGVGGS